MADSLPGDPDLPDAQPPANGRIDVHSHLLPAIDDGCVNLDQSLACVRSLIQAGFVGSICTPHILPEDPACNAIDHIRAWTAQLNRAIREMGLPYRVWPGGELRLYDGVIDWLTQHTVPTLANSRCVLVDFWEARWPEWATHAFAWLIERGYQPILAHPERLACTHELDDRLKQVTDLGVWLQGNFRSMTGEEGIEPDRWVRKLLAEDRYQFMAMDMHRPDTLSGRFDGLAMVQQEFGQLVVDRFLIDAPRKRILAHNSAPPR